MHEIKMYKEGLVHLSIHFICHINWWFLQSFVAGGT